MDKKPIYIHSLFRSGSTYIFNTFRNAQENYYCYQEPLHEFLLMAKEDHNNILEADSATATSLRHVKLKKPYFYEFFQSAQGVADTFNKSICYDLFFDKQDYENKLKNYIDVLFLE